MGLRRIVGCSLPPIVVLFSVVLFSCAQRAPDEDESAEVTKSTAAALTDPDGSSDASDAGSSPTSCALTLSAAQSGFFGTAELSASGQYEPIDFAANQDAGGATSGAIWLDGTPLPITNGFDLQFSFQEKKQISSTPTEGFAVVLQSESAGARGADDGNLGYGSIPDSLALEADSHQDTFLNDPSYEHLSLHTLYASPNSASEVNSIGVSTFDAQLPLNFDNSSVQELRIQYRPADPSSVPDGGTPFGSFNVWMNQNIAPTLQAQVDDTSVDSIFTGGAYVGFTASRTSGFDEEVLISNVSLSVQCPAVDQCHVGSCDSTTGACATAPVVDGTACDDGNKCTQSDTCQAGTCTGSPVVCTASDSCHVAGTCDPLNGTCSNPQASDGATCNDSNACTQSDTCQAGMCTGSNPVTCTAIDQCHVAGTCDPSNGTCSNPPAADGATCNDGGVISSDAGTDAGNDGGRDLDASIPPVVDAGSDSGTTTIGDSGVTISDSGTSSSDASTDDDSSGTDSGCSCRMTGTRSDTAPTSAVAFLTLAIGARIRRRRQGESRRAVARRRTTRRVLRRADASQ